MLHRINKAQPASWVDPSTLQIGLGENQIRLPGLSTGQQQVIAALYSGLVVGQEDALEESIGAPAGEVLRVLNQLGSLAETNTPTAFGAWTEMAFSEIARASIDYQVNGEMVLAERWQKSVHIDQLDRTGLLLSKALLASGVGKIVTHDTANILNTDLGELGYPSSSLNKNRTTIANQLVAELQLTNSANPRIINLSTKAKQHVKVSFGVSVGHLALNPRTYSRWLARDVHHLGIIFSMDYLEVSPVITPGKSACLNCYQEHIVDQDSAWPVIASQLLDLPRMRDDSAALLAAVSFATRSILRDLDEQSGFEYKSDESSQYSQGYKLSYDTGSVNRTIIAQHSLCSCNEFK